MKKFNKNIIVFILAAVFIGFGFSANYLNRLFFRFTDLIFYYIKVDGISAALSNFTTDIDRLSTENLRYHSELMDLDSLKHVILNTRLIPKDDVSVVKTDANTLTQSSARCSDEVLNNSASAIQSLQLVSEETGADFLYIAVPPKNAIFTTPENVENHAADNYTRYLQALRQKDIPVLDLYDELRQENMLTTDTYFMTDHHWTPETGFWATEKICNTLHEQYGFEYNNDYVNIENFNLTTYPDCLLGSYGKKQAAFLHPAVWMISP